MPYTNATHWYYRVFKPSVENDQLLQNNPEDWSRLQVWDGKELKPVMDAGFSGVPSEDQINMLHSHVQNKALFFFKLGDPTPLLVGSDGCIPIPAEPKEPTAPQPPQSSQPSIRELEHYNKQLEVYNTNLSYFHIAQALHEEYGPGFNAAIERYYAGRDPEQDSKERASRTENSALENNRINRARANRVISEMMSPRPSAPADIFFVSQQHNNNATIHYQFYTKQLKSNGYDLPKNDKLTEHDAATIHFAMLGVQSQMEKVFYKMGGKGPAYAKSQAKDGFHMMITGLFGYARIDQPMKHCLGEAMKLGKAAISAYLRGNPQLLGQRLAESVQSIKTVFTGTTQYSVTESLTAATKLTERLVNLFDKNPDIWKATGLQNQDLDYLRGYVQIGNIYDKYLDSQIKFNAATVKGIELTQAEKTEILVDSLMRRMVEKALTEESHAAESSDAYTTGLMEAGAKDHAASIKLNQWKERNRGKIKDPGKYTEALKQQQKLLDHNVHSTLYITQPMEHAIINTLALPGMVERLRQSLMQDPAILAQASKSPMAFTGTDLQAEPRDALIAQVQPTVDATSAQVKATVEASRKQAWFDSIQSMLAQGDMPWLDSNVAADSDRLMIAQVGANGIKTLVSVASLLEGGLQALQNPDKNTLDLLYAHAKNGNLYYYGKDKDMPARLSADGAQASTQQLEPPKKPTRWMLFWNLVTGGRAYAAQCNPKPDKDPAAFDLFMNARASRSATATESNLKKFDVIGEAALENEKHYVSAPLDVPAENTKQQASIQPVIATEPPVAIDVKDMNPVQFQNHLESVVQRGSKVDLALVLSKKNGTPKDYYEAVAHILEGQVAQGMLDYIKNAADPDQFLNDQKIIYAPLVADLQTFVAQKTDPNAINTFYAAHKPQDASALLRAAKELTDNGVNEYLEITQAKNTANEQPTQQKQAEPQPDDPALQAPQQEGRTF